MNKSLSKTRIYRYIYEDYVCWTSVIGGLLQAALYGDFLYYYIKRYACFNDVKLINFLAKVRSSLFLYSVFLA